MQFPANTSKAVVSGASAVPTGNIFGKQAAKHDLLPSFAVLFFEQSTVKPDLALSIEKEIPKGEEKTTDLSASQSAQEVEPGSDEAGSKIDERSKAKAHVLSALNMLPGVAPKNIIIAAGQSVPEKTDTKTNKHGTATVSEREEKPHRAETGTGIEAATFSGQLPFFVPVEAKTLPLRASHADASTIAGSAKASDQLSSIPSALFAKDEKPQHAASAGLVEEKVQPANQQPEADGKFSLPESRIPSEAQSDSAAQPLLLQPEKSAVNHVAAISISEKVKAESKSATISNPSGVSAEKYTAIGVLNGATGENVLLSTSSLAGQPGRQSGILQGQSGKEASASQASPFSHIDAGAEAPRLLHASPREVAVGVRDPALGWVEIQTQTSGGHVSASLAAGSAEAHASLVAQMPAMSQYLEDRNIHLRHLDVGMSGGGAGGAQPQADSGRGSEAGTREGVRESRSLTQSQAGQSSQANSGQEEVTTILASGRSSRISVHA